MITLFLFIISVLSSSYSQYWQKKTAMLIDSNPKASVLEKVLSLPALMSIFFLFLAAVTWLGVLREWSVSIAYPMLSVNFIIMLFISHFCFGEDIKSRHWLGSVLILSGVALLGSAL
ncbi:EamA family transporter [Vibrio sp. S4M6]|uniref:EamA family transporter n=1 Tax=Vibrio sinus TaxID=2946865 RepID=UPI00202AB409|nr:EamA family transporter [Vibrio sinus]MCL9780061.1 EamA family transporter [Vibrio sinus]